MIPSQDNSPPYAAINVKLAEVAKSSPSVPPWYTAWRELGPGSSPEDRLKVYQAVRDAGSIPEEAGFHLLAWQIDAIACERTETELHEMEDRLHELEAEAEREGQLEAALNKSPSEYTKFLEEYYAAWDDIFARTLREFGEGQIADLFVTDQEQFQKIDEAGRRYFHGPLAGDGFVQQTLFDDEGQAKQRKLDAVTDAVREKFGSMSLSRGNGLKHQARHRPDPNTED